MESRKLAVHVVTTEHHQIAVIAAIRIIEIGHHHHRHHRVVVVVVVAVDIGILVDDVHGVLALLLLAGGLFLVSLLLFLGSGGVGPSLVAAVAAEAAVAAGCVSAAAMVAPAQCFELLKKVRILLEVSQQVGISPGEQREQQFVALFLDLFGRYGIGRQWLVLLLLLLLLLEVQLLLVVLRLTFDLVHLVR